MGKNNKALAKARQSIEKKKKYSLVQTPLTLRQYEVITSKTPKDKIFERPGKGGMRFAYVKGSYVKKRLNYIFGSMWSFEIIDENITSNQVIVKGKLTILGKDGRNIVKMQYGRADIKFLKGTKEPVDLGNDCKASATDCLKKCASDLGICADVYADEDDYYQAPAQPETNGTDYVSRLTDMIDNDGKLKDWATKNNLDPTTLTQEQAQEMTAKLLNR